MFAAFDIQWSTAAVILTNKWRIITTLKKAKNIHTDVQLCLGYVDFLWML